MDQAQCHRWNMITIDPFLSCFQKKKKRRGKKIETPMWPKIIRGRINMVSNGASKDLDEEAALSKRYVSWMGLLIYMDRGPMMQHELLAG